MSDSDETVDEMQEELVGTENHHHDCPLCNNDDLEELSCLNAMRSSEPMKAIMAREIKCHGLVPDDVIYRKMARDYNKTIREPMLKSGLECPKWTTAVVKRHFKEHVQLLPRRLIAEQIKMLTALSRANFKELETTFIDGEQEPIVDPKLVTKAKDLAAGITKLTQEWKQCVKEDLAHTGSCKIWRNHDAITDCASLEIKNLIDKTATIQSAAGVGDRPVASELFQTT